MFAPEQMESFLTLDDAQEITNRFNAAAKDFGLNINIGKTELLYQPSDVNDEEVPVITIDGETLKTVKPRHFKRV